MQEIDFYLVDAFSDKTFGGNAAAVCPLEAWLPDETLLKMAQQHNQSETAFFVRTDGGFELRWFTTLDEINLCGHATLAASHVIFEYLDYPHTEITFTTRFVGELTVKRSGDWLTLNFPAWSTEVVENPPALLFSAATPVKICFVQLGGLQTAIAISMRVQSPPPPPTPDSGREANAPANSPAFSIHPAGCHQRVLDRAPAEEKPPPGRGGACPDAREQERLSQVKQAHSFRAVVVSLHNGQRRYGSC